MEKRRVRLVIEGIVCGLITEEDDAYMEMVSAEVSATIKKVIASSPFITREAAALTAALSYCDEAKKGDDRLLQMKRRVYEMERKMLEAQQEAGQLRRENAQLWEETGALLDQPKETAAENLLNYQKRVEALETENALLKSKTAMIGAQTPMLTKPVKLKNPLRHNGIDQQGLVSFFARNPEKEEDENDESQQ